MKVVYNPNENKKIKLIYLLIKIILNKTKK
jgi:hypothetical protein